MATYGALNARALMPKMERLKWAEACRCAATTGRQNSSTSTGDLLCRLNVDFSVQAGPTPALEASPSRSRFEPASAGALFTGPASLTSNSPFQAPCSLSWSLVGDKPGNLLPDHSSTNF